jgi:hypothetical protein
MLRTSSGALDSVPVSRGSTYQCWAVGRSRQTSARVVSKEPGLYFVGLHFLYLLTSETIFGVQRDAKRIAKQVAARKRTHRPAPEAEVVARSA